MKKRLLIIIIFLIVILNLGIVLKIIKDNRIPAAYCDNGYTLENNVCIHELLIDVTIKKYCDEDYKLDNGQCIKIEKKKPTKTYYCLEDSKILENELVKVSKPKLIGTKCYVTISHEVIEREECPLYYTPIFDDYCLFRIEIDAPYDIVRKDYRCPKGPAINGKCVEEFKKPFEIHQYCADGFKISNGKCEKEDSYDAGFKITCPNGFNYVNDNICEKITTKDIMFEYICPNEYTLKNNSVCSKIISKEPYYK
ncbi:MAG: hypothetical protein PUJ60_03630 [bacterium]|nr:hypothetical protein [bacterium]MDY4108119.1 hypothetical protein [Bacilli bacterium]